MNHKRVRRLAKVSNFIYGVNTTDSNYRFPRHHNALKGMLIRCLNHLWLSDIICAHMQAGFIYLVGIHDVFSQKVIDYAVTMSLDTALTLKALKMTITVGRSVPGVVHHSDQGVQYA